MLTPEENKMLTSVGPGTPCGEYMRLFWHPIAVESEVGKHPLKVRVLGEDFVLFRDGSGKLGLLDTRCPHRGASLEHGYVEESGLRCRYHGWMFSTTGQCLEQPAEPPESSFKERIKQGSYPVGELGGFIFGYFGRAPAPPLPKLDVLLRKDGVWWAGRSFTWPCNYLQGIENGVLDPWHTFFAHAFSVGRYSFKQGAQKIWFKENELGVGTLQVRKGMKEGELYVRENSAMMPNVSKLALRPYRPIEQTDFGLPPIQTIIWRVPVDDTTHVGFRIDFMQTKDDATDEEKKKAMEAVLEVSLPDEWIHSWPPPRDTDGAVVKKVPFEDAAITVSQGAVSERWKEHLGTSDREVIMYRQLLKEGIEAVKRNKDPKGLVREDRTISLPIKDDMVYVGGGTDLDAAMEEYGRSWLGRKEVVTA